MRCLNRYTYLATREFFLKRYGIELPPDAITSVPLEGEGKVEDRVDLLFKQFVESSKGWVEAVRQADLILVSSHSQGGIF